LQLVPTHSTALLGAALAVSLAPAQSLRRYRGVLEKQVQRGIEQSTGAIRPYCYYGSDAALLRHGAGRPGSCGPGGKYNTMPDERVHIIDYLDAIRMHALTISTTEQLAASPRLPSS
jgi:hypothetical protein